MTEAQPGFTGGCLCERVRYVSTAPPITTVHCCCTDCRKIGGTGHATHTVVPLDAFTVTGDMTAFEWRADSGNKIVRRFCPACGSAIYHTRDGLAGMAVIRTSSMDDPERAVPDRVIYAGSRVTWDHLDPGLPTFAKMSTPPVRPNDNAG